MLNGALPYGLVYMALSLAIAAPTSVAAIVNMYAFGAGTVPMLLLIILLKRKAHFMQLSRIRNYVPVLLLVFGSLFVLRGMNLDIPYLSPQAEVSSGTIKNNCCTHHQLK